MTSTASIPTTETTAPAADRIAERPASWAGVVTVMLGVLALVTSEFLPASLLPSMAADLRVTEGVAGQMVTATALVGVVAGPAVGLLFPRLDRRRLLLGLLGLALVANVVTALSPWFWLVLVARLLLGAAISGTWAMALAVSASLVPARHLGRAVMLVNVGVSIATVAAVPLGAFVGSLAGWRTVFAGIAAVTVLVMAAQAIWLRPVAASATAGLRALVDTVRSPALIVGLAGVLVLVAGHFAAFTFVRPAAAAIGGLSVSGVAILLAVYGIGGFAGNLLAGAIVDRHLGVATLAAPVLIGASVIVFATATGWLPLVFVVAALWGIGFGAVPTTVQTWSARTEPERMESAGGLVVATFQLGIAAGAAIGGVILDATSAGVVFTIAGVAAVAGGVVLSASRRIRRV